MILAVEHLSSCLDYLSAQVILHCARAIVLVCGAFLVVDVDELFLKFWIIAILSIVIIDDNFSLAKCVIHKLLIL